MFWYVEASHGMQTAMLALGATLPGEHAIAAVEPAPHAWPGGQALQSDALPLPVVSVKVPASHGLGVDEPASQKLPDGQVTHDVLPLISW